MQTDTLRGLRILTDEYEMKPILDLERYSETIANITLGSNPRFSIGVYGEWGYGKTTLMRLVQARLKDRSNVLTIWFNAWRYEREDQFAITALMKTIAFAMSDDPTYKNLKSIILRSIKIFSKGFLSEIASKIIGAQGVEEFVENVLPKMELLSEVDRETIYFDGIQKIETEMGKIISANPSSRVVVFIDDLDRCSPKKALEVFETIKVFLDIQGFIFVIGLSHDTVSKLLSAEFREIKINGDQYIRKIIQIPIFVPDWNSSDLEGLIKNISGLLDTKYSEILGKNVSLIANAVELSPRELKRFINNFIVAYEIYSINTEIKPRELLVVQAIKIRWGTFYRYLSSNENVRAILKDLLDKQKYERMGILDPQKIDKEITQLEEQLKKKNEREVSKEIRQAGSLEYEENTDALRSQLERLNEMRKKAREVNYSLSEDLKKILVENDELWVFLENEKDTLFSIKDWEIYRRAAEAVKEIPTTSRFKKKRAKTSPDADMSRLVRMGISIPP